MKITNILFVIVFAFVAHSATAQVYSINAFISGGYNTINDDYNDSLRDNIEADDNVKIEDNAINFGADAYIVIANIVAGAGIKLYSLRGDNDDLLGYSNANIHVKAGYNLSSRMDLNIIPALRLGLNSSSLEIPYISADPTTFGDYIVQEDDVFTTTGRTIGAEIGLIKIFSARALGIGLGVSAFMDYQFNEQQWKKGSVDIDDTSFRNYSYFGVEVKIGGILSNFN